jgi:hypothetical protein
LGAHDVSLAVQQGSAGDGAAADGATVVGGDGAVSLGGDGAATANSDSSALTDASSAASAVGPDVAAQNTPGGGGVDEDATASVAGDAAGGLPGDAAEPVAGAGAVEGGGRESGGSQVVSAASSIAAAGVALPSEFGMRLEAGVEEMASGSDNEGDDGGVSATLWVDVASHQQDSSAASRLQPAADKVSLLPKEQARVGIQVGRDVSVSGSVAAAAADDDGAVGQPGTSGSQEEGEDPMPDPDDPHY